MDTRLVLLRIMRNIEMRNDRLNGMVGPRQQCRGIFFLKRMPITLLQEWGLEHFMAVGRRQVLRY